MIDKDEVLPILIGLKNKYKEQAKSAITDYDDNVSHLKFVGKVRGINEVINIIKNI